MGWKHWKKMKAKGRLRFDVDLTLFSIQKRGCYKRLILLRRTILTEKRRKSVKSVFKEEILEKWNRFLCWSVDCVNWSTASRSQGIQTLCNICVIFEIGFHSEDIRSRGSSKGVCLSPSSFFFDKVLVKMSKSIANMIPIEQIIWKIKHELLINDWRLYVFEPTTCSMNFSLTNTGSTVMPILKLRSFSCLLTTVADVWSFKRRHYWLFYFHVKRRRF